MARFTDLPTEIIARIFTLLSPTPALAQGSLAHASHAFALALCSTSLLQIFRQTLLTSIDASSYTGEPVSPYFPGSEVRDPFHLASLVRLAGPYLRKIIIPKYEESEEFSQRPLLKQLPHCPNLDTLAFHDPRKPSGYLRQILARVSVLRINNPSHWTLRHVGHQVEFLELTQVNPKNTRDVLTTLSRCMRLKVFYITFRQGHDTTFIPLLVRTLAVSAVAVQHVRYRCPVAPLPVPPQQSSSVSRTTALSTIRVDAGHATFSILQTFDPLIDDSTTITTVHSVVTLLCIGGVMGVTRSVGILGPVHNLEEAVITQKEEVLMLLKQAPHLKVIEIGKDATAHGLQDICEGLRGKALQKITIPGDLLENGLACAAGLGDVNEIVISELGCDEDIWELVTGLPAFLRGLRRARRGDAVRVIHIEGCLQVLDGVWQYGRVKGYGLLRNLLWEMEQSFYETGVDFCGLREGVRRLLEERDRMMVIDEM